MPNSTHFHRQLLGFLRQYSDAKDLRHSLGVGMDGECFDLQWTIEPECLGALCP